MSLSRRFGFCAVVSGLLAVAGTTATHAAIAHKGCGGCSRSCGRVRGCSPFTPEFFGHYPTCWRVWPEGSPTCPRLPYEAAPAITAPPPREMSVPETPPAPAAAPEVKREM